MHRGRSALGAAVTLALLCAACGSQSPDQRTIRADVLTLIRGELSDDGSAVCSVLSSGVVAKFAAQRPGAGSARAACTAALKQGLANALTPGQRSRMGRATVASVTVDGLTARIVVDEPLGSGLTASSTDTAIKESGIWKLALIPSTARVGNDLLYRVPSGSMEPTFKIGDDVLVDPQAYRNRTPAVGDVIVFHPPTGANDGPQCGDPNAGGGTSTLCEKPTAQEATSIRFIKRVVGLPGDRLQIAGGHVIRNGVPEKDPYTTPCGVSGPGCTWKGIITVPAGLYYVLGDNRGESDDSRYWGPIEAPWIIGKVVRTLPTSG
jgi:signal peptidase I